MALSVHRTVEKRDFKQVVAYINLFALKKENYRVSMGDEEGPDLHEKVVKFAFVRKGIKIMNENG